MKYSHSLSVMGRIFLCLLIFAAAIPLAHAQDEDPEASDYQQEQDSADLTFHGYACTVDCSGHKAGYDWAARKGIQNEEDCGGNSNSFIEGCRAFVEENR